MDLSKLTLSDKILGGAGIVLILSLLFFPWHDLDFGVFSESRSAIQSPNAFWGLLALLVTIAIVAYVVVTRFTSAKLPSIPLSWGDAVFYATIAVLALLLLKLIIETDLLGWGAWLSILLAAGLVYGGFLKRQELAGRSSGGS